MRTLTQRLREAEQIDHPTPEDYARLLGLASDMEDEIDRLRDMLSEEIAHREMARSEVKFWLSCGNGEVT